MFAIFFEMILIGMAFPYGWFSGALQFAAWSWGCNRKKFTQEISIVVPVAG
jgi:hypothetical protein